MSIRAGIDVLSATEKQLIHEKSLRILEKIGVHAPHTGFLQLMEEHGAVIDWPKQVMRLPAHLVNDMMDEIRLALAKPDETNVQPLSGSVSTEVFMVDYATKTRRPGLLDDVKKGIALLNHLPSFASADAIVVPSDVPNDVTDLVTYQMLFTYSKKPSGTYILSPATAPYIIEMARFMQKRIYYGFQTVSPLRFMPETLEIAMIFKEQGMPAGAGPFVLSMGSGPITTAGSLLMQNAEQLACIFCTRLLGGAARGYYSTVHPLDAATLLCSFGSPNLAVSAMAGCSMARYYGLYPGGNVGLTDSLEPDFQCGFEKALTAAFAAFSGNRSMGAQGIVGADQGISLEQLVIDDEWISAFNYCTAGFKVDEETLAEALIHELGIGGSFISEEHTVRHFGDSYWPSSLFNRHAWDAWKTQGSRSLLDRAHDQVEAYTAGYENLPHVITPGVAADLNRIVLEGMAAAAAIRH